MEKLNNQDLLDLFSDDLTEETTPLFMNVIRGNDSPLSHSQQRLWILDQISPDSAEYILPYLARFTGDLSKENLEKAINTVIKRHEALRTTIQIVNEEPHQIIAEDLTIKLEYYDLTTLKNESENEILNKFLNTPFNLARLPLIRSGLIKLAEDVHIFILTIHHIVSDGLSLNIILKEIGKIYNSLQDNQDHQLKEVEFQFADYVYNTLSNTDFMEYDQKLISYAQKLKDAPYELNLPLDFNRNSVRTGKGRQFRFNIPLKDEIKALKKKYRLSEFMIFLAAYALTLKKHCQQNDLLIGLPSAGREIPEVEKIVGYFVNTLVVRVKVEEDKSLDKFLKSIRRNLGQIMEYQDVAFDDLVNRLKPSRNPGSTPLIQTMFSFQNVVDDVRDLFKGLTAKSIMPPRKVSIFDITLDVLQSENDFEAVFEYDDSLFKEETIADFSKTFLEMLNIFAKDSQSFQDVVKSKQTDTKLIRQIEEAYSKKSLNRIFEILAEYANENPEEQFLFYKDMAYTRKETAKNIDSLAKKLLSLKINKGDKVGLCLNSEPRALFVALGILKSGGVLVPVDLKSPSERIDYILSDADVKFLIHDGSFENHLEKIIEIDISHLEYQEESEHPEILDNDEAYIIYTSGTTGKPKGVVVNHKALDLHLESCVRAYNLTKDDISLQFAPLYFDAGLEQLFAVLTAGGKLIFKGPDLWSVTDFIQSVNQHKITIADIPPLYIRELLEVEISVPDSLRVVISGGEKLPLSVARKWLNSDFKSMDLINAYGPTESIVTTTAYKVCSAEIQKSVPIGSPLQYRFVVVLDEDGKIVPKGVSGEICVGGDCLADGYLNRPDLTKEKFANWFFDGQKSSFINNDGNLYRIYRTGDKGKVNHNGLLEFEGRLDNQVKIRGFRIELSEIEDCLNNLENISKSYVTTYLSRSEQKELIAYFIADKAIDISWIKEQLSQKLPVYMIPKLLQKVENFALTNTGKVDPAKLPEPAEETISQTESFNEAEQKIKSIWSEVLGLKNIGLTENFFDCGGNSLLLIRLHGKLVKVFEKELKVVDLFRYTTIKAQSAFLSQGKKIKAERKKVETKNSDIAIIGMAGRFPGANNTDELWKILENGEEKIRHFSKRELLKAGYSLKTIENPDFVAACGYLEDEDKFDADFFGITPAEAKTLDPQHRIFLEEAYHALEDGGYNPFDYDGRIGVYAGVGINSYMINNLLKKDSENQMMDVYRMSMGNDKDFVPTRTSYKLNLMGPSLNVNTACSSSLTAIHLACKALNNNECEMALAGGVSIHFPQIKGSLYQKGGIVSPDGKCRAFADDAAGTVGGNGTGVIMLKPLKQAILDKDNVIAVIKGTSVSNDGGNKAGFTAPGIEGQSQAIKQAQKAAGIEPNLISYLETHGTGTPLGDPIEIESLNEAFGETKRKQYCAIGSVKTNIGHLDAAAGVASAIKTALAIIKSKIPASLNCPVTNSKIDFANSPFYVNTSLKEWTEKEKYAGVSSFGMGGTNAHIIMANAPETKEQETNSRLWLLPLSAQSEESFKQLLTDYEHFLKETDLNPADIFFTLLNGRKQFKYRAFIIADSNEKAQELLAKAKQDSVLVSEGFEDENLVNLAEKWLTGDTCDFTEYLTSKRRVRLPLYPFNKKSYWIDHSEVKESSELKLLKNDLADWFYAPVFTEESLPEKFKTNQPLTIVHNNSDLEKKLISRIKERYSDVETLTLKDFTQTKTSGNRRIIYTPLFTKTDFTDLEEKLAFGEEYGLKKAADFVSKAAKANKETEIIFLTTDLNCQDYEKSLLTGFVNSIQHEYSKIKTKLIDFETSFSRFDLLLSEFSNEIDYSSVLIKDKRLIKDYAQQKLADGKKLDLNSEKVCLITGARGGMGLTFAEHLAKNFQTKLVLLTYLEDHDKIFLNFLARLKKYGSEILLVKCDLTSEAETFSALNKAYEVFGKIDLVIHTAGSGEGKAIPKINAEHFKKVLHPKTRGSLNLINALKDKEPEFFISCSSLTSQLGALGQSVYAAANEFLNQLGKNQILKETRFISINWDRWLNVGMAAKSLENNLEDLSRYDKKIAQLELSDYWPLNEHKVEGECLFPGTAYLDFLYKQISKGKNQVRFKNLKLTKPFFKEEDSFLGLSFAGNRDFIVTKDTLHLSLKTLSGSWEEIRDTSEEKINLAEITSRCNQELPEFSSKNIIAGKHWLDPVSIVLGENEGVAKFDLSPFYKAEKADYPLSPGVLDKALSFLIITDEHLQDFFPVGYDEVEIYQPLSETIYSYAVFQQRKNEKIAKIDVLITDETGLIILKIKGYTLAKAASDLAITDISSDAGISSEEGIEVLKRAFNYPKEVLLTCVNNFNYQLDLARNRVEQENTAEASADNNLTNEEALLEVWCEVLGVNDLKVDDDLLEQGADSLGALQASARLKEKYGLEFSISQFFENLTISKLSSLFEERSRPMQKEEITEEVAETEEEMLELTSAQQRIWFVCELDKNNTAYLLPTILKLTGKLDFEALEKSLEELLIRHQAFRTCFVQENSKIYQTLNLEAEVKIAQIDAEDRTNLRTIIMEKINTPFDLRKAPLIRFELFKVAEEESYFAFTMHHIISDGWSVSLFLDELIALYNSYSENRESLLPELETTYWNYVKYQRKIDRLQNDLDYWKEDLAEAPEESTMPVSYQRPAVAKTEGDTAVFYLDADLTKKVRSKAKENGMSVNSFLMSAYYVFLSKYSKQNDLVVGIPIANRKERKFENLVGMFVNMLPFRVKLAETDTFFEFAKKLARKFSKVMAHSNISFEKLLDELKLERSLNKSPLFQTTFTFLPPINHTIELNGLKTEFFDLDYSAVKNDLAVYAEDCNDQIKVFFEYSSALYAKECADSWKNNFMALVDKVCKQPDTPLVKISIESDAEKSKRRSLERNTEVYQCNSISGYIYEKIKNNPENYIEDEQTRLTYKEIDKLSDNLASSLKEFKGSNIIVSLEKTPLLFVAIVGILKAGCAYLPVEPSLPKERIKNIINQAKVKVVLGIESDREKYAKEINYFALDKISLSEDVSIEPHKPLPDDNAYLIFTSGSTGEPKGVLIPHGAISNTISHYLSNWALNQNDKFMLASNISFDASVLEIFMALCSGGSLSIAPQGLRYEPQKLLDWLTLKEITCTIVTTPVAERLFDLNWSKNTSLRILCFGGQALTRYPKSESGFKAYNLYGPTETAIIATESLLEKEDERRLPDIGKPITNVNCYVLDKNLRPVPIGVQGELYIGGKGLAKEYIERAEETAKSFFYWSPSTYNQGKDEPDSERIYKSGDLVKWNYDGKLEYLGRADNQVKIRGYRIEPGEIQKAMLKHKGIEQAEVIVHKEQLQGFYKSKEDLNLAELKQKLAEFLPSYMVPSGFTRVKEFPYTRNGKTDYKKLTEKISHQANTVQTDNLSRLEQKIRNIWCELLDLDNIGSNENFFDLGGHSLLLVNVKEKIQDILGVEIEVLDLFKYTTIKTLSDFIKGEEPALQEAEREISKTHSGDIAVVGLALRFPGADSAEEFWQNLASGKDAITTFSKEELLAEGISPAVIADPDYIPRAGIIEGVDKFDAEFFGYSPNEAKLLDPQQRILLECAYQALEDAGYARKGLKEKIGVFSGISLSTYLIENLLPNKKIIDINGLFPVQLANGTEFASTRVAYKLNLNGPAISMNTACSTSLTAIHMAVSSLFNNDCDLALAGGSTIRATQKEGYFYEEGGILSKDGVCRPFDEKANGTIGGSGSGIVVLKRLEDARKANDKIYAVIKGTAINNDGKDKIGFTAPGIIGQSGVIKEAHQKAGVDSNSISYVETHGTATILGDPIEVKSLKEAFGNKERKSKCYLGSVKASIGHLDSASGIAGFIKTVLALKNKMIPKSINFEKPNPKLKITETPFEVAAKTMDWNNTSLPRRAGVSAFGIGGTNVHVVLEEAETGIKKNTQEKPLFLTLSGKNEGAVIDQSQKLRNLLEKEVINTTDLAYTLATSRDHFEYRKAIAYSDFTDLKPKLNRVDKIAKIKPYDQIVFMFTGQGSQYPLMGKGLYNSSKEYRAIMDECLEIYQDISGINLKDIMWQKSKKDLLNSTEYTQPALFITEYTLAKYLESYGVKPTHLIGHSIGEITSAAIAGLFSLTDALTLVHFRGTLMVKQPTGSMIAISLPEKEAEKYLFGELCISVVNSEKQTVVSGCDAEIEELEKNLKDKNIRCRVIPTSHAFHSSMLDGALEPFTKAITKIKFTEPKIPFISNTSGVWAEFSETGKPEYWAKQIRSTVKFHKGISTILQKENICFIEVGPAAVLSNLTKQNSLFKETHLSLALQQNGSDEQKQNLDFNIGLGSLWEADIFNNFTKIFSGLNPHKVAVPLYSFQRKRYWVERPGVVKAELEQETNKPLIKEELSSAESIALESFKEILGIGNISKYDDFFNLGGDSLLAASLVAYLKKMHKIKITIGDVMQNSTPEELAKIYDEGESKNELPSCLIKLTNGDQTLPPVILIHAVGGGALIYKEMLKYFKVENPVYGLKSVGLWDGKETIEGLKEQAANYCTAVNQVFKDAKLHLAGCSYGGIIAYEMKKILNEQVSTLSMFDSPGPGHMPMELKTDLEIYAFMLDPENRDGLFEKNMKILKEMTAEEAFNYTIEKVKSWSGFTAMSKDEFKDQFKVLRTNLRAMNDYSTTPADCKIYFFKAMEKHDLNADTPELAWIPLAEKGVNIIPCQGDHISMLSDPHVENIANRYKEIILTN